MHRGLGVCARHSFRPCLLYTSHSTFLSDLDFIIADFAGLDLKDLDIGEFLTSLISLARKNDVELPSVCLLYTSRCV